MTSYSGNGPPRGGGGRGGRRPRQSIEARRARAVEVQPVFQLDRTESARFFGASTNTADSSSEDFNESGRGGNLNAGGSNPSTENNLNAILEAANTATPARESSGGGSPDLSKGPKLASNSSGEFDSLVPSGQDTAQSEEKRKRHPPIVNGMNPFLDSSSLDRKPDNGNPWRKKRSNGSAAGLLSQASSAPMEDDNPFRRSSDESFHSTDEASFANSAQHPPQLSHDGSIDQSNRSNRSASTSNTGSKSNNSRRRDSSTFVGPNIIDEFNESGGSGSDGRRRSSSAFEGSQNQNPDTFKPRQIKRPTYRPVGRRVSQESLASSAIDEEEKRDYFNISAISLSDALNNRDEFTKQISGLGPGDILDAVSSSDGGGSDIGRNGPGNRVGSVTSTESGGTMQTNFTRSSVETQRRDNTTQRYYNLSKEDDRKKFETVQTGSGLIDSHGNHGDGDEGAGPDGANHNASTEDKSATPTVVSEKAKNKPSDASISSNSVNGKRKPRQSALALSNDAGFESTRSFDYDLDEDDLGTFRSFANNGTSNGRKRNSIKAPKRRSSLQSTSSSTGSTGLMLKQKSFMAMRRNSINSGSRASVEDDYIGLPPINAGENLEEDDEEGQFNSSRRRRGRMSSVWNFSFISNQVTQEALNEGKFGKKKKILLVALLLICAVIGVSLSFVLGNKKTNGNEPSQTNLNQDLGDVGSTLEGETQLETNSTADGSVNNNTEIAEVNTGAKDDYTNATLLIPDSNATDSSPIFVNTAGNGTLSPTGGNFSPDVTNSSSLVTSSPSSYPIFSPRPSSNTASSFPTPIYITDTLNGLSSTAPFSWSSTPIDLSEINVTDSWDTANSSKIPSASPINLGESSQPSSDTSIVLNGTLPSFSTAPTIYTYSANVTDDIDGGDATLNMNNTIQLDNVDSGNFTSQVMVNDTASVNENVTLPVVNESSSASFDINATLAGLPGSNSTLSNEMDPYENATSNSIVNETSWESSDSNISILDSQTGSNSSLSNETDLFGNITMNSTIDDDNKTLVDDLSSPYTLAFSLEGFLQSSRFGSSVSLSADGSLMAVGATESTNDSGESTGAIFLFSLSEGMPLPLQGINGTVNYGEFGNAVALSNDGNRIVVGSRSESEQAGAVRVYERYNSTYSWIQVGDPIMGQTEMGRFGWAVAISGNGNIIAVGSPTTAGGSVSCFELSNAQGGVDEPIWINIGSTIDGLQGEAAGYSLSLSYDGFTLAVGAPKASNPLGSSNAGKATIYNYADDWSPVADVYGESAEDIDGTSVAISQDGLTLVTGAKGRDGVDGSLANSGYCRIYEFKSDDGFELIHTIWGENAEERMGSYVATSLDGNTIACGGTNGNLAGLADTGIVRLWNRVTLQESHIWPRGDSETAFEGATFGSSIAVSADGKNVLVGAPAYSTGGAGSFGGAIQIFRL